MQSSGKRTGTLKQSKLENKKEPVDNNKRTLTASSNKMMGKNLREELFYRAQRWDAPPDQLGPWPCLLNKAPWNCLKSKSVKHWQQHQNRRTQRTFQKLEWEYTKRF